MKRLTLLILLVLAGVAKPAFAKSALADACLQAPAPRLRVGGEAVVAEGVDRLNMRALPAVDTGVRVQLYSGNTLSVIGGPSCNGLYTWWRVESANGSRGWVAEATWDQYFVVPIEDAAEPPTPFEGACLKPFDALYCL
ncbi:MAG: SH3 domain-containing protein [Chloroflexota bacterium]